MTENQTTGC